MSALRVEERQLTLDVGGEAPIAASFKISGRVGCMEELPKGADVRVLVLDADGQVVATSEGFVSHVQFKEHRERSGMRWTERVHGIRVE